MGKYISLCAGDAELWVPGAGLHAAAEDVAGHEAEAGELGSQAGQHQHRVQVRQGEAAETR